MPGLRERKKQRTRDALVDAAFGLFRERGFEATTVADIAEAADIAPRTFFAYFETKEAVVFHDFDLVRESFAARLGDRRPGETAFEALRAWVEGWLARRGTPAARDHVRHELVRTTPALQVREQANKAVFEQLLGEQVALDLGVSPESLRPRMVSAAAIAALTALTALEEEEPGAERAMALVDEALAFAEGGLEVLRRRPPIA